MASSVLFVPGISWSSQVWISGRLVWILRLLPYPSLNQSSQFGSKIITNIPFVAIETIIKCALLHLFCEKFIVWGGVQCHNCHNHINKSCHNHINNLLSKYLFLNFHVNNMLPKFLLRVKNLYWSNLVRVKPYWLYTMWQQYHIYCSWCFHILWQQ